MIRGTIIHESKKILIDETNVTQLVFQHEKGVPQIILTIKENAESDPLSFREDQIESLKIAHIEET